MLLTLLATAVRLQNETSFESNSNRTRSYSTDVVNPVECTYTTALGTRGHVRGNMEVGVEVPRPHEVHGKDSKILGLDIIDIRLVGNGNGTSCNVVFIVSVNGGCGLTGAAKVRIGVSDISAADREISKNDKVRRGGSTQERMHIRLCSLYRKKFVES